MVPKDKKSLKGMSFTEYTSIIINAAATESQIKGNSLNNRKT